MTLEEVAKDYSKYCKVDMDTTLKPISKSIDDMLARLEEFQTILSFIKQDEADSSAIMNSIPTYKNDLDEMCSTIDRVESLMAHIKCNLDKLEDDVEKAETELGYNEHKKKVANIFTPLFVTGKVWQVDLQSRSISLKGKRKSTEKKQVPVMELFKTEDYFK